MNFSTKIKNMIKIKGYKLTDIAVNTYLKCKYYLQNYNKSINYESSEIKAGLELIFSDYFSSKKWSNFYGQQQWTSGNITGADDPNSDKILTEPLLSDPTSIGRSQAIFYTKKSGDKMLCSELTTSNNFKFGRFEIRCKFPTGKGTWPAFWLWGKETWPPEIDIFEAYGREDGKSINELQFNLWKLDNGKSEQIGCRGVKIASVENATNYFHEVALEWRKDKLELFFNGVKVLQFTDQEYLDKYINFFQRVVVNNSVENANCAESEFTVSYVRIYKFI